MNRDNLSIIIGNYINHFETIKEGETYKWMAIQHFQSHWNIEADDFGDMFKNSVSATINMINNRFVSPTAGIIELAKHENDVVREMFINLFADDGGDLVCRQNRIDEFVSRSEELLQKYAAGKWKFRQDVRIAITYLCLRYPDENYLYKATSANLFAKYVDFGNDIGGGRNFKLANYYQMCDQIAETISQHQNLLQTNSTRLDETTWPDSKYHLLASDIVYCASGYSLFGDIIPPSRSKKTTHETSLRARKESIDSEIAELKSELNVVREMKAKLGAINLLGEKIKHKKFGHGEIISHDKDIITIKFDDYIKKLGLPDAFSNKSLSADSSDVTNYFQQLEELVIEEKTLERSIILSEVELKIL